MNTDQKLSKLDEFLHDISREPNAGLGGEAGYYVFSYDPKDEMRVRQWTKDEIKLLQQAHRPVVEFDLYKEDAAGTITGDAAKALGLDSRKKWLKINTKSLKTNENGEVSQSGLANGIYYLVETKTNEGYNLLKAPVKVELNIEYTTTKSVTDENGVKHEVTKTEFKENTSPSNGTHTETIINKKGFTLPTTGGMGTIAITALGVALAFAGVLIIGASRKKTVK